jgi:pimeloyl-ACP methyl ester carboxylesterase
VSSTAADTGRRYGLAAFAALNALAAWGGAVGLATGAIDFGERIDARLPFDSLVLAGLALAVSVAIPLTVLAWAASTRAPRTDVIALVAGLMLIAWIVVQVVVLRAFSLFQPTYLGIGAAFVAASHRVELRPAPRGILLVGVGAIVTAAGVGLVPHLVKNGLTVTSMASVAAVAGGIAVVVAGTRTLLRDRQRVGKLIGGVVAVIVVALVTWVVAPAVAATNVPRAHVRSTPAEVGLEYESVTLTTADSVQLAAWYLRGTNGAGVVVMHGAGSTRSDVLDEAAVLVAAGYAVVLVDARGHGDSRGTAMDFGWFGDLDVAAGTEFLATRPEIDSTRIGVVGFSMGGEEAIGAAAADPRIRAVVAEGATGRVAADKDWLSDAFGWRGWIQEWLESLQDGITDFLTDASPPVSLRSAVGAAPHTRFLLITAGVVDDEARAAEFIRSGASERVTVWNVAGAGHIGGYDTKPTEWQRRVIAFLDVTLN